ncbi:MAG: TonB-dependent receptor [Pseudomonadales bacterium]|nr:TonB-dependent receptor [Pseudomonadales bacterium]
MLFFAQILFAQNIYEMSLVELMQIEIVTASRYNQDATQAAAIVTVIDAEEIAAYGATRLVDILQRLPSVVPLFGELFHNSELLVRGENGNENHILTLINGQPLRSALGGSTSNIAFFQGFPVSIIERIEFIRGPGSVLYGSNAYTGVINIITQSATQNRQQIAYQGGSFSTYKGSAQWFQNWREGSFVLSAEARRSDGWPVQYTATGTVSPIAVDIEYADASQNIFAQLRQKSLSLSLYHNTTQLTGNRLGQIKNDYRTTAIDANYSFDISPTVDLDLHLSWQDDFLTIDQSELQDKIIALELISQGDFHKDQPYQGHWLLGSNIQRSHFDIHDKFGLIIGLPENKYAANNSEFSIFGQWEQSISTQGQITIGAQVNKAENRDSDIVPRLAYVHNFNSHWGSKIMYSGAYRAPSLLETDLDSAFLIGSRKGKNPGSPTLPPR